MIDANDEILIEEMVSLHGEEKRLLITDSLKWLLDREPSWGLDEPMDRKQFLEDLLSKGVT